MTYITNVKLLTGRTNSSRLRINLSRLSKGAMATQGNVKFQKRAKIFLANFPQEDFGEPQLRQLCEQFGEVGEVRGLRMTFISLQKSLSLK
jgi:hypothetical protein